MNKNSHILALPNKSIINKHLIKICILLICIPPIQSYSQNEETTINALVKMGFENVSRIEDNKESIFIIENTPYRLNGIGIGKAIDLIQQTGLPENKDCRLIILNNNIPQISLLHKQINNDSVTSTGRQDWVVSYELGDSWKKIKNKEIKNSSLYKIDILVYPEFSFQNYKLSRVYDILLNLSPAIEVSLWKGMKFTGQIIIPIVNNYGVRYEQVRPGFITLSQTFRLPQRTFLTSSVGLFNNFRWGFDAMAKHFLKDERFSVEGRLGYTGRGYFENWAYYHGTKWTLTGELGGNIYWPLYNTQFSLKAERYLEGEYGLRFDMIRHFRYTSIGFYAMKVEHAGNNGFNGGFRFQIALPPYRYKRKGYIPRVMTSNNFGISYNAGNERTYGKGYKSQASDNIMQENSFNPYFIRSELLNQNY
ncbi:hypothetical protein [uncultured Bacteroides sp.]|uniref:hypothetical protein n=1 Tax=uncultured Bacteroides sp. TaxID=162156 RepID=UPI002AA78EDC|nr:hypothetical protein [uncultured Bacteroides sp.]